MDRLVILDEKEIRRLVGKNPKKTIFLYSITSAITAIDVFIFGLDLTWALTELTLYGILFISGIVAVIDIIAGMLYLKKKRQMWMQVFEQQIEQKPKISELKEKVFPVGKKNLKIRIRKLNFRGILLFVVLVGIAGLIYLWIIGGI